MLKYETKQIDPDAESIIAALTEATAAANKRCRSRLLNDDPAKWRKFARSAAASPEGYAMFRGGKGGIPATQVLAAWWTDSIGRKHVVVRGRRVEHLEARLLLQQEALEAWPPLWHAFPEYVCRRTTENELALVCACGCGAVGTPQSLGWMGATCGPCADRKEELGEAGLAGNTPGVLYSDREPLGAIACAPDGCYVAAVEGRGFVSCWDISRRIRTVMRFDNRLVTGIAITPSARHLLVTGIGVEHGEGLFAVFDLSTDPPTRANPANEHAIHVAGVVPLPDPTLCLINRVAALHSSHMEMLRVPSGVVADTLTLPTLIRSFAVSPDGSLLAYCGDELGVWHIESRTRLWNHITNGPSEAVTFSHDAKRLFAIAYNTLLAFDTTSGKRLARANDDNRRHNIHNGVITTLVADPGGLFIYASTRDGVLLVYEARSLKCVASFEWHLGAIRGLAVSADGSKLFSSGNDGCVKVWPIRDLLRGVETKPPG